jgi:hypothetical protein
MRFVPAVAPQPREMIDLGGVGGSNLHHRYPVTSVTAMMINMPSLILNRDKWGSVPLSGFPEHQPSAP